jgi:hypothetical protein
MLRDLIRDGHDHARTKRHLATAAYGCTCRSDTCTVIEEHQWIVADGRGYWRTDDPAEVERYIHSLEGRRDSLTERAQALRAAVAARKADVTQTSWLDAA